MPEGTEGALALGRFAEADGGETVAALVGVRSGEPVGRTRGGEEEIGLEIAEVGAGAAAEEL